MPIINRRQALVTLFLIAFTNGALQAAPREEQEHQQIGTNEWIIPPEHQTQDRIQGYANATSVNRGSRIKIYVKVGAPDTTYSIRVFRTGYYRAPSAGESTGAREMMPTTADRPKVIQPSCLGTDPADPRFVECHWNEPYELDIPAGWPSGVYLALLTAKPSQKKRYVIFVVRADDHHSSIVVQTSVATYQAYNEFGGRSLYDRLGRAIDPSSGELVASTTPGALQTPERARRVSFDRPYLNGDGSGEYLQLEYPTVRWLEREGYDVTYIAETDTHTTPSVLTNHRVFVAIGHSEYWSFRMRQNVETARDAGVSLAFLTSNAVYWQIRFARTTQCGDPTQQNDLRVIVSYKEDDPGLPGDPEMEPERRNDPCTNTYPQYVTRWWRKLNPEVQLMGVQFNQLEFSPCAHGRDMFVSNNNHWMWAGTGVANGQRIAGVLGYEIDSREVGANSLFATSPAQDGDVLADSPFPNWGGQAVETCKIDRDVDGEEETVTLNAAHKGRSTMTIYRAPSGAWVWATGSIFWFRGLDRFNRYLDSADPWRTDDVKADRDANHESEIVKRVTRNFFAMADPPTLTGDPLPPVDVGTPITWRITGRPTSQGPHTFRFWVHNEASGWRIAQSDSYKETLSWTHSMPGPYRVQAWIKNPDSADFHDHPDAALDSGLFTIAAPPAVANVTVSLSNSGPVAAGTRLTLTASGTGGGLRHYRFYVQEAGTWRILQDYSGQSTVDWTPLAAGTTAEPYRVQVWARSIASGTDFDAYSPVSVIEVTDPWNPVAVALEADRLFPLAVGTPVTWTATAAASSEPLVYQYWLRKGTESWTVPQPWGSTRSWTWTPTETDPNYEVQVWIRSETSLATTALFRTGLQVSVDAPPEVTSVLLDQPYPVFVGASSARQLRWTAYATGGMGPLQYKFYMFDATSNTWTVRQDWTANNQLVWTPGLGDVGAKMLQVWVRSSGSTAAYEAYSIPELFVIMR